jgi:hypothetical protein
MKYPEEFSPEAVTKRSAQATKELDVAARSAKVKRELDNAQMEKKERRPLKEFSDFRVELNEGVEEVEENFIPHSSMPPNILILRRKTVRQFPNNVMVALYYNDKLGQYFSIPYGGEASDDRAVITPVALKENEDDRKRFEREKQDFVKKDKELSRLARLSAEMNKKPLKENAQNLDEGLRPRGWTPEKESNRWSTEFEHHVTKLEPKHTSKVDHAYGRRLSDMLYGPEEAARKYVRDHKKSLNEDAISHLQKVKAFQTDKPLYHKDGSQTRIDPTTANALLTVHGALHPDNRKKFADALEHSQPKFHKMLDFAWKQVRE